MRRKRERDGATMRRMRERGGPIMCRKRERGGATVRRKRGRGDYICLLLSGHLAVIANDFLISLSPLLGLGDANSDLMNDMVHRHASHCEIASVEISPPLPAVVISFGTIDAIHHHLEGKV